MALWTDQQLQNWIQEGETAIAVTNKIVITRFSLDIIHGQSEYILPDFCTDITRVTMNGFTLDPMTFSNVVSSLSSPRNVISSARPLNYVYSGFGTKVIKLYPAPGVSYQKVEGDLFNAISISSGFIIECYRSPDFSDNLMRIPDYIRKPINKYYVMNRALEQDGPGQDLTGAAQFLTLLTQAVLTLKETNSAKFISRENILSGSAASNISHRIPRPILPPNYPVRY